MKKQLNEGSDWILLSSIDKLIDSYSGVLLDKNDPMMGVEISPEKDPRTYKKVYGWASNKDKATINMVLLQTKKHHVVESINFNSLQPINGTYGFNQLSKMSDMGSVTKISKKIFEKLVSMLEKTGSDIFTDDNDKLYTIFSYGDNYNLVKLKESINESTSLLDMFRELQSFSSAGVTSDDIKKASSPENKKINVNNNKQLKSLVRDWGSGEYDESPDLLVQRLRGFINESVNESFHGIDGKPIGVDSYHRPIKKITELSLDKSKKIKELVKSFNNTAFGKFHNVTSGGDRIDFDFKASTFAKDGIQRELEKMFPKSHVTFVKSGDNYKVGILGKGVSESVNESDLFTKSQIHLLRKGYENIGKVDPSKPTYAKLIKELDKLSIDKLKQLSNANIKFVSMLAKNRVNRIKNESINESSKEYDIADQIYFRAGGNEIKFYDAIEAYHERLGHPKYMLWLSAALKSQGIDMYRNPKTRNPQEAEEYLYNLVHKNVSSKK